MTHVLRGTVEAIVAVALVAIAVYLWRRQRRLTIERGELIERERVARQALEQAHRDIETLLNTVSHDLKGPLFTFTGYLDLLKLEAAEGLGEAASYIDRMTATAEHMQDLINGLVAPSTAGRPAPERETV